MAVRIERKGPVFTVILSRPGRRNAVDGPTANALADAFREFDADPNAAVAALFGEGWAPAGVLAGTAGDQHPEAVHVARRAVSARKVYWPTASGPNGLIWFSG